MEEFYIWEAIKTGKVKNESFYFRISLELEKLSQLFFCTFLLKLFNRFYLTKGTWKNACYSWHVITYEIYCNSNLWALLGSQKFLPLLDSVTTPNGVNFLKQKVSESDINLLVYSQVVSTFTYFRRVQRNKFNSLLKTEWDRVEAPNFHIR